MEELFATSADTRNRRDMPQGNNNAASTMERMSVGLIGVRHELARNTGRNRNGNLLMRDMYHFSDRRGGRRSSLLNGSNCNLGMLNRLRDPMYRESGPVNHNTTMTRRRHLSERPIRNEDGSLIGSTSFFHDGVCETCASHS